MRVAPEDLLRQRAYRMLTDGERHDEEALRWARGQVCLELLAKAVMAEWEEPDFTRRELSLGAQREWG